MAIGLILHFANLKGWLLDENRIGFLNWILNSQVGLPIDNPAGVEFMKSFPPPPGTKGNDLTHVTKQVVRSQSGPVLMASINYMHRDGSRTEYIATLSDVRKWSEKTPYPWIAWFLTLFGFCEVLLSTLVERKTKK